jgi:hypothetical protein
MLDEILRCAQNDDLKARATPKAAALRMTHRSKYLFLIREIV